MLALILSHAVTAVMRRTGEQRGRVCRDSVPYGQPALVPLRTHPVGLVVLLDLNMPRMDGVALLRALPAEVATRQACILCTSHASRSLPLDMATLLSALGIEKLCKPFSVDALLRAVADAEGHFAHLAHLRPPASETTGHSERL